MMQHVSREDLLAKGATLFDETHLNSLIHDASKSVHMVGVEEHVLLGTIQTALHEYHEQIAGIAEKYSKPVTQVTKDFPFSIPHIERSYLKSIGKEIPDHGVPLNLPKNFKAPKSAPNAVSFSLRIPAGNAPYATPGSHGILPAVEATPASTMVEKLTTEHKVGGGISLIAAAMSGAGAYSDLRTAFSGDTPDGKVDGSLAARGMLQLALAAGFVYLGAQTLRGESVFR